MSTLKALELCAEVVSMTECCKILVFKFIIIPEVVQIEHFHCVELSACIMSKKNPSMRWGTHPTFSGR